VIESERLHTLNGAMHRNVQKAMGDVAAPLGAFAAGQNLD
jgi:hypothetical protein